MGSEYCEFIKLLIPLFTLFVLWQLPAPVTRNWEARAKLSKKNQRFKAKSPSQLITFCDFLFFFLLTSCCSYSHTALEYWVSQASSQQHRMAPACLPCCSLRDKLIFLWTDPLKKARPPPCLCSCVTNFIWGQLLSYIITTNCFTLYAHAIKGTAYKDNSRQSALWHWLTNCLVKKLTSARPKEPTQQLREGRLMAKAINEGKKW